MGTNSLQIVSRTFELRDPQLVERSSRKLDRSCLVSIVQFRSNLSKLSKPVIDHQVVAKLTIWKFKISSALYLFPGVLSFDL